MQNVFMATIDKDGNIMQIDRATSTNVIIGRDLQAFAEQQEIINSQQEIIDNYYNKLVELGVIEIEKTAEEIALETANKQIEIANKQIEIAKQTALSSENMMMAMMKEMQEIKAKMNIKDIIDIDDIDELGVQDNEFFTEDGDRTFDKPIGKNIKKKSK